MTVIKSKSGVEQIDGLKVFVKVAGLLKHFENNQKVFEDIKTFCQLSHGKLNWVKLEKMTDLTELSKKGTVKTKVIGGMIFYNLKENK